MSAAFPACSTSSSSRSRQLRQLRRKLVQGAGQLARRDEMGAPIVGQSLQRLAGERQAVARAGDGAARMGRIAPPCGTGVGQRDQVAARLPLSTDEI